MEKGYIQVYTGNGKGKSTAAFGLALRAVGAGLRVYIGQFVKDMEYAELRVIRERIPEITVETLGQGCFIDRAPDKADKDAAQAGLKRALDIMRAGKTDVVILDEIFIAHFYKLVSDEDILALMRQKPEGVELVLTGRYAPETVVWQADLVTDMYERTHYYEKDVPPRDGIER